MSKHWSIYGDESINKNIVCYSILLVPTNLVVWAESLLLDTKNRFGIPKDVPLHCNELWHSDKRDKLNLNLTLQDVESLYLELAYKFRGARKVCCIADQREFKNIYALDVKTGAPLARLNYNEKRLVHECKNGSIIEVKRRLREDEYSFYKDPDKNGRMEWGNIKKAKLDNHDYNTIIPEALLMYEKRTKDLTKLRHTSFQEKPILIEVADFLAYFFAKSRTAMNFHNKGYFTNVVDILKPDVTLLTIDKRGGNGVVFRGE